MANALTGDFDAVLQVAVRQVNGILATLHHNWPIQKNIPTPVIPQSVRIRLDEPPPFLQDQPLQFAAWVSGTVSPFAGASTDSILATRDSLIRKTPPGLVGRFNQSWDLFNTDRLTPTQSGRVQGVADIQVSSSTISVPAGSTSEVVVHAFVRAHFFPDPGARGLPRNMHGEVRSRYRARPTTVQGGRPVLRVEITPDDNQIEFIPEAGTGLSPADVREIAIHVRASLRKQFRPFDVTLPPNFAFSEFKALGSGDREALALPLQLSDQPPGNIASVTNHFIGPNDFALGVGRDYIDRILEVLKEQIRTAVGKLTWEFLEADYTASVSRLDITWKPSVIEVSGRIEVESDDWWGPDGHIEFKQGIRVVLKGQQVELEPAGEPEVDESWFIPHGRAESHFKSARDGAINMARPMVNAGFADALRKLDDAVRSFDGLSSVRYDTLEQTIDGIIVRGSIHTHHRFGPKVMFEVIDGGASFSAANSVIPGGRITGFAWSWVESGAAFPWDNKVRKIELAHEFICHRPSEIPADNLRGLCFQMGGTRITEDGRVEPVIVGEMCSNHAQEGLLVTPAFWVDLSMPYWAPDPPPIDFNLSNLINSHISVIAEPSGPGFLTANTIVHFPGVQMNRPLTALSNAIGDMRRQEISPAVVIVLPEQGLNTKRSELEAALGAVTQGFRGRLFVTEDSLGGWTTAFDSRDRVSTHVITARGDFAFRADGAVDSRALARALDQHAVDAPPPRSVPLRLTVAPGFAAPDGLFNDVRGNQFTLRKLRGRDVLMVFFQTWSAPSIRELRRLKSLAREGARPFVIAISTGERREVVEEAGRRDQLDFALVYDPDRVLARLYGIRSWPTLVTVNEDGIVEGVQFGATPSHDEHRDHDA